MTGKLLNYLTNPNSYNDDRDVHVTVLLLLGIKTCWLAFAQASERLSATGFGTLLYSNILHTGLLRPYILVPNFNGCVVVGGSINRYTTD